MEMILPSKGHLATSGDIFGRYNVVGGTTGISWVEDRDAAKHPKMYRTVPTNSYPAQNINSAKTEGPSYTNNKNMKPAQLQPQFPGGSSSFLTNSASV